MKKESIIFPYRNLPDFEKILFLEKQVRTLIKDLKAARFECGVLKSELAEKIDTDAKTAKIRNQLRYIKDLEVSQRKLKADNASLMYKLGKATRGNNKIN